MSKHQCPQQQCTCTEVQELSELYRDLKCQRKRARDNNNTVGGNDEEDETRECISAMELQMTRCQAEHVLGIVKTQRDGVGNLMIALREFSQKLSKQEEMLCQTDKEIAELREEMRRIKEQYDKKQESNSTCAKDTISVEEVVWRQALDLEIHVQCKLKNKIKQLTECLESRKQCECDVDKARQDERKVDAKLLLNAMDYVEKCIVEDQ